MKKNYVKPDAECIAFYSEENITADLPLSDHVGEEEKGVVGGSSYVGELPPGWEA